MCVQQRNLSQQYIMWDMHTFLIVNLLYWLLLAIASTQPDTYRETSWWLYGNVQHRVHILTCWSHYCDLWLSFQEADIERVERLTAMHSVTKWKILAKILIFCKVACLVPNRQGKIDFLKKIARKPMFWHVEIRLFQKFITFARCNFFAIRFLIMTVNY